jgi:hypothetical protein
MIDKINVKLVPLDPTDRNQFVLDNQEAFKYGATEEFGMRDDHFEVTWICSLYHLMFIAGG